MRFRTTTPHYLPQDRYVDAGVEIGDDTPWPLPKNFVPSHGMEGVDEEGKQLVRELDRAREPAGPTALRKARAEGDTEIERLQRENDQLRSALRDTGPSGMEPFYPQTSTGPTAFPQNINKEPGGDGVPRKDVSTEQTEEEKEAGLPPLKFEEAIPGSSSTTPPRVEMPGNSAPISRSGTPLVSPSKTGGRLSKLLGQPQTTGTSEGDAGMEMPEAPAPDDEGPDSNARPGDQSIEDPNKNMTPADVDPDNRFSDPGSPNATGPVGSKSKKG